MAELGFHSYIASGKSFYEVLTAAISDIIENGYDSEERVAAWMRRLKEAATRTLVPERVLDTTLKDMMRAIYRQKIERGGILTQHPGVSRFTLDKVQPRLRAELDRRIMASANLIKLNRTASIEKTLQRFSGWATSIPPGGSDVASRKEAKEGIRKSLASLPFEERRVATDQAHKFVSNLNSILANDAGAIAGIWVSHKNEVNYNGRPQHNARDGHVFLIRDSWAHEKGLVKPGADGYTDDIEACGELVFCRCFYRYIYSLRHIPSEMLTEKGRAELERVRIAA